MICTFPPSCVCLVAAILWTRSYFWNTYHHSTTTSPPAARMTRCCDDAIIRSYCYLFRRLFISIRLACVCLFITSCISTQDLNRNLRSILVFPIYSTSCAPGHSFRSFVSAGCGNAACLHLRNLRSLREGGIKLTGTLGCQLHALR